MSNPTTVTLTPRYSDCDRDGQLHIANYVRLMLQTALQAAATADLNEPGLEAAGWLEHVGDIGLQVTEPILFGDSIDIQTRLAGEGPPLWRRTFSVQRTGSGAQLAAGFVDLFESHDDDDEEDEIETAVVAPALTWDGPVPSPAAPPEGAFRSSWRVLDQHLDISSFLDPANLTHMAAEMANRAAEIVGWGAQRNLETGIFWFPFEHRLELFKPIESGDLLNFISYVGEVGDDYVDWHSFVGREGDSDEAAHARLRWACISAETGERCAIPKDWRLDLADLMTESA